MKKVSFTTKPSGAAANPSPDNWVAKRSSAEPTKRLTVDVPFSLHHRMKVECAVRGERMADVVRELLENRFAQEYDNQERAGESDH